MELVSYILLLFLGFVSLGLESKNVFKFFYFPCLVFFILIVRFSGFDADIITYAKEMHSTSFDIYYLREFVFWFTLRFLYWFFQSDIVVFLILDFIWLFTLFKIQSNLILNSGRFEKGLIIVFITSFPFLLGYENIYRQFLATVILLYSYSLVEINTSKAIKLFLLSFFIHNVTVLMLPVFIVKKCYKFKLGDRVSIALFLSLFFVISLGFLALLKSSEPTRLDMSFVYLALFCLVFVISIMRFKNNIYKLFEAVPSLLFSVVLMLGLVNLDVDMIAERLGMMFIIFLIFDLYKHSVTLVEADRILLRLALLIGFSLPVFLFTSSMKFLI